MPNDQVLPVPLVTRSDRATVVDRLTEAFRAAEADEAAARARMAAAVVALRTPVRVGWKHAPAEALATWETIGSIVGTSKQAAAKRVNDPTDDVRATAAAMFETASQ